MQLKQFYILLMCITYAIATDLVIDCTADFGIVGYEGGTVHTDYYRLQISPSQNGGAALCMGFNISTIPQDAVINSATLYYRCQVEAQAPGYLYPGACQISTDFSDNGNYDENVLISIIRCIPQPGATTFVDCSDPSPPVNMTEALRQSISNKYDQFKICTAYYGGGSVIIDSHDIQSNNAYIIVNYSTSSASQTTTTSTTTTVPTVTITTASTTSSPIVSTQVSVSIPASSMLASTTAAPSSVDLSGKNNAILSNSAGSLFFTLYIALAFMLICITIN